MAGLALPRGRRPRWATQQRSRRSLVPPLTEGALLWAGLSLFAVTALLNFYVFEMSVVATSAYEIQRLHQGRDHWLARNEQLHLELVKARSLPWVEYEATQRLGMVPGERPLFLSVDRETPDSPPDTQLQPSPEPAQPDEAPLSLLQLLDGAGSLLGWLSVRE